MPKRVNAMNKKNPTIKKPCGPDFLQLDTLETSNTIERPNHFNVNYFESGLQLCKSIWQSIAFGQNGLLSHNVREIQNQALLK